VPIWDSSAHLLYSYDLKDALTAPIPLEEKLHALFTCSGWYPPLFNWVHCLFLMCPTPRNVADDLPRVVFFAIGLISLYKLGRQLFNDAAAGLVAMAIFFALPGVCGISHARGLLDMPLASMYFLALWLIARWSAAPSWANALLAGCAIGLACLTKQMGAIFLGPAVFLVLIQRLFARDFGKAIQFSCGVALASIPYLIWLLPHLDAITKKLVLDHELFASRGSGFSLWFANFQLYLQHLSDCTPVPLSVLFLISLFNFPAQRKLWLPASALPAFMILCILPWGTSQVRYVLPILGYLALSTAALLVRAWRTTSPLLKALDVLFGLSLLTIYFVFNFTPYPFPRPPQRGIFDAQYYGFACSRPGALPSEPNPEQPVAYNWLLARVQSEKLNRPGVMMVAVDTPNCALTSIEYLARQRGIPLQFQCLFSSEVNVLRCNPANLNLDPNWYVTMKNDKSAYRMIFYSEQDLHNYENLMSYFETSGKFSQVSEFLLPDGESRMILYRKVSAE